MDIKDILWLSFTDLKEKKVRTALTIFMVVIGVASIVALVSLTAGISASIQGELSSLGPTSIILTSTKASGFTIADTADISTLPNVSIVVPIVTGSAAFLSDNQNSSVTVVGVTPQGLQELLGGSANLYEGAVFNDTIAPDIVVGHTVAFPSSAAGRQSAFVGQTATLKIGSGKTSQAYTVPIVGIMQAYGASIIPIDTAVMTSMPAAEALLHKTSFNEILVKATNTSSVSALSALITDIYGSNARVLNTQQLAATAASIVGSITLLLIVIAGISLFVASIGIMNIMLMAVLEKTHEIGIMKSIGFKSRDVLTVFLFQALLIGVIGGIIGIILGAAVSYGLAAAASAASSHSANSTASSSASSFGGGGGGRGFGGRPGGAGGNAVFASSSGSSSSSSGISFQPVLSLSTVLEALFVAILVSALAGIYPAWRASKMQPIDALRQL